MVDTPPGVVPLQLHTDSSNGHNVTEDMLPMVLVVPQVETPSVVVMDAKASS